MRAHRSTLWLLPLVVLLFAAGCGEEPQKLRKTPFMPPKYEYGILPEEVKFSDDVTANVDEADLELTFTGRDGMTVDLETYRDKKNVLLVVMRGFSGGEFCPYCTAQTSRLLRNYEKFSERETEVVVVYPGVAGTADDFAEHVSKAVEKDDSKFPFPLVLDEDLKVVNQLELKGDLAKPATYIRDKAGKLRFAYVGSDRSDRPSLKAIFNELDKIQSP